MLEAFSVTGPVFELLIAMLLGAFLGIRIEMKAQCSIKNQSFMGVRTMTLLSGCGVLSTFFSDLPLLPIVFFVGILGLLIVAYAHGSFKMNRIGLTTELSAIITFWIGVLVGHGQPVLAILLTILLAGISAFKEKFHSFVGTLNIAEWNGAFQLLILSGAVLPFLPRTPIDPWGVIVPFTIWSLVILISGIGFVGYFFIKYLGPKGGIPLAALFGSFISSTAVTTSMAAQSQGSKLTKFFAVGILIGLATMQARVALIIILLGSHELILKIISVPIVMTIGGGLAAWHLFRSEIKSSTVPPSNIKIKSPFELKSALKFGFIFIVVLFAVTLGKQYFGSSGVYVAALFSGLIDVDALVLSSLQSVSLGELSVSVAKNSIAIAIITNTIIKLVYVAILGTRSLFLLVSKGIVFVSLLGLVALLLS